MDLLDMRSVIVHLIYPLKYELNTNLDTQGVHLNEIGTIILHTRESENYRFGINVSLVRLVLHVIPFNFAHSG